jgi:RNA polymerase sigma factor (TIGR02999 family)
MATVTRLLGQWGAGDPEVPELLMPLVYDRLRGLARRQLSRERNGHTLSPTALVHEAYLRLAGHHRIHWQDRGHFLALAATTMRRVLVSHARGRLAEKRGGGRAAASLEEVREPPVEQAEELVALDDALEALAAFDPRQARVVELRYFGGLTVEETAAALGVSLATVKLDWSLARAWLRRELTEGG